MKKKIGFMLILFLICFALKITGQEITQESSKKFMDLYVAPFVFDPALSSIVNTTHPNLVFETQKTDKTAKMSFGISFKNNSSLSFLLSAPLNDYVEVFTFDGLASYNSIEIGFLKNIISENIIRNVNKTDYAKDSKYLGASLNFGLKTFKYLESDLKEINKEKISLAGSVFFGMIFNTKLSMKGSVKYQYYYQGNPENEYLIPFDDKDYFIKKNVSIGEPKLLKKIIIKVDAKYYIDRNNKFGINPGLNWSIKDKAVLFDLPIYFIPNQDKNSIDGGVTFRYKTGDSKGFAMALFIGLPFSIE